MTATLEQIKTMSEANLEVGTWTSPKGEKFVSLTRNGRYRKNIAVPLSALDTVLELMRAEAENSK